MEPSEPGTTLLRKRGEITGYETFMRVLAMVCWVCSGLRWKFEKEWD